MKKPSHLKLVHSAPGGRKAETIDQTAARLAARARLFETPTTPAGDREVYRRIAARYFEDRDVASEFHRRRAALSSTAPAAKPEESTTAQILDRVRRLRLQMADISPFCVPQSLPVSQAEFDALVREFGDRCRVRTGNETGHHLAPKECFFGGVRLYVLDRPAWPKETDPEGSAPPDRPMP